MTTAPSVLDRSAARGPAEAAQAPACFADLNLDQVVAAITAGREGYRLRALFHAPLEDPADVAFRHAVFRDLADERLRAEIERFARAMQRVRHHASLAETVRNPRQRPRLQLGAASAYCDAVTALAEGLARAPLASDGLRRFSAYLSGYLQSHAFASLDEEVRRVRSHLDAVTYGLTVLEDRVHVRRATRHQDYTAAIERTFSRFHRQPRDGEPQKRSAPLELNPVEAAVLELVARLHPEAFSALEAFGDRFTDFVDDGVARFEREIQFYLAYLDFTARFEGWGLGFCFPEVMTERKDVRAVDAFDVALALRLLREDGGVVCNDFALRASERVFVVTGANQGGKTTFARMFGQLHYLAALGCPVPGSEARLFLCDTLLTHFQREEDLRTLQGKLQEELTRLRQVLDRTGPRTIVIMNEAFASTAADDALFLGRETLERLLELDALTVYVTFVDELSRIDPRVASLTATVDPDDPAVRTFKLVRRPADGRAYALAIARAYGLTYDELRTRMRARA
jgi:DNA mismatch repair protein MutS